jgi:endoglucanase
MASLPHANQILYALTTQEEIGLRGAHTASDTIKPEIGIALEAGVTGDVGARPEESQERLGGGTGPSSTTTRSCPTGNSFQLVKDAAAAWKLPLQFDLVSGYGDDSAEIQKSNGGVPMVCLMVPVRYTHAHNGVMNRRRGGSPADSGFHTVEGRKPHATDASRCPGPTRTPACREESRHGTHECVRHAASLIE